MRIPSAIKLPSGRWRVSVQIKGVRHSITKDTKKDAERAAALLKMSPEQRAVKMTYREAIDAYIKKYKKLSPATVKGYRDIQNSRVQSIMDLPISACTDLQTVFDREADKVSVKTLKNAYGLLSVACKNAGVEIEKIKFPQGEKKERPFLNREQIKIFCKAIEGEEFEIAYLLCLHSLRRSEMLAMKKSQVTDGYIHVHGAIVEGEKGFVYKSTNKTEASVRDIPIFIPRLTQLVEAAPDGILCPWSASMMDKRLRAILEELKLPISGFHMLRHSFASMAWAAGVDPLVCMRWGGWSEYRTMIDIYTHMEQAKQKEDASKLMNLFTDPE